MLLVVPWLARCVSGPEIRLDTVWEGAAIPISEYLDPLAFKIMVCTAMSTYLLTLMIPEVLLFNGEFIVLQRLNGQLIFNSDYHVWDEDWLKSKLTIPYECRPLPSPLL